MELFESGKKSKPESKVKPESTEGAESKAEGAESKAEGAESAEGSGQKIGFLPVKEVAKYIVKQLWPVLVAIGVSVLVFFVIRKWRMKIWKKLVWISVPVLLSLLYLYFTYMPKPRSYYFLSVLFGDKPIKSDFSHKASGKGWPYSGSSVLVMNDNNYIFIGGGDQQDDVLLLYNTETKKFDNVISEYNISDKSATYSAVSIDIDGDGLNDLVVGRENGVTLYKQTKGKKFKKIPILGKKDKVPLGLSISDFNKDGRPDIYVSYFTPKSKYRGTVFNDPSHSRTNVLLKNTSKGKKDLSFEDVTVKTKSGGKYNTFSSAWVDLNNDTYPDLVLANDSGEIEILKNKGGKGFETTMPHNFKWN